MSSGGSGSHSYDACRHATYVVTLTVTDSAGVSATTVKTVTVNRPGARPRDHDRGAHGAKRSGYC